MKYLSILVLCMMVGCSSASTSMTSKGEILKPHIYAGTLDEIHDVAFSAAKRAFPEEADIFKNEEGKVTIERDWFWRGDTIIEVWVKKIDDEKCIIEAESRPNWHRGNGTLLNVSKDELVYYLSTLDKEYQDFLNKRGSYKESSKPALVNRLQQLKEALDNGLINNDEYNTKRSQILDEI